MSIHKVGCLAAVCVMVCLWAGCGPTKQMTVLIKMVPQQEEYFKTVIAPPFEKKYSCKLNVVHFEDMWKLDSLIKSYDKVGFVKTPFDVTREIVSDNDMLALDDFLLRPEMENVKNEYFLISLGTIDGKIYYLPRKFECRLMVYLKSKVLDAVNHWTDYKDTLNTLCKSYNGYGLPYNYELESDPNKWDFYDLYVTGFYWAHTPYNSRKGSKIAHRARKYSGTALTLVDRAYELNAKSDDILLMNSDPIIDQFEWEALYMKDGIYNSRMWKENWAGGEIWQGFKSGEVFLSFMTQLDCFNIHGTGTKEMPGFLDDPDDMGVAVMPKGVSLQLDDHGNFKRIGKRAITTGGWWWGIPKTTPDPKLSFELARWITSTDNQVEECSNFGMVPVRKDILGDIGLMFGGGWITNVFNASFAQLVENRYTTIPLTPKYGEVGKNYIEAWYDICIGQNCIIDGKVNRLAIESRLNGKFVPIQKQILGSEYPSSPSVK